MSSAELALAKRFCEFVNASPSAFHAVSKAADILRARGFQEISERNIEHFSNIKPKGKYFFTRNQSSLISFSVGGSWVPGNGFSIAAAHTDSPVLKIKPISKNTKHGFIQVGVEPYGGGLWHTWFDRDLSIAGRVVVAKGDKYESKLVRVDRPILRIPNLAIHLQRDIYEKGFNPNKQTHVLPILATSIKNELERSTDYEKALNADIQNDHHPLLLDILSKELNCDVKDIRDFELNLFDTQDAIVGGAMNEFIFSRALDNLMMSFLSVISLADSTDDAKFETDDTIRMVALFDNEEIGSVSAQGAASNMLYNLLARISQDSQKVDAAIRKSFLLSADMAHAVHPNYADLHEENHRPQIHKGCVIKENCNLRYATNGLSAFILTEIARIHNIPFQKFVVRNDTGCGSTVGPILSANCGIRTVDIGVPQLSMHSIREMCGVGDVEKSYRLLTAFFNDYSDLDKKIQIDQEQ